MKRWWLALLLFLFLPAAALTIPTPEKKSKPPCKGNPELVGDCFVIHGRLRGTNGTPSLRIWRIGTSRMLGVHEQWEGAEGEESLIPDSLWEVFRPFHNEMYGDFLVCPFTREKPSEMQIVCVQSVSNWLVKEWDPIAIRGEELRCKDNSKVAGECFTVRGRLGEYNGSPSYRIWRIGTTRILGVEAMPERLRDRLNMDVHVYGDFLVCPFSEEKPEHMQFVCIESAGNVTIQERYPPKQLPDLR